MFDYVVWCRDTDNSIRFDWFFDIQFSVIFIFRLKLVVPSKKNATIDNTTPNLSRNLNILSLQGKDHGKLNIKKRIKTD